jgi:FixJ family two-component response regulator
MKEPGSVVYIVDDDREVRVGLESLIRSVGLRVSSFASASEFQQAVRPDVPSCLVLDVRMPGQSGLELQNQMRSAGIHLPIIFVTGHGDIPMTVRAMKDGAMEFLTKPVRGQDLLDAVQKAIEHDRDMRRERAQLDEVRARFNALTPRENEVLHLVVEGLLNKQIADKLGMSELTVKTHRAHVMEKTGANSLAHLVRMTEMLKRAAAK